MTGADQADQLAARYPVGEKQPDRVRTRSGRPLAELNIEGVLAGDVTAADFGITADGLRQQADISELASRPSLARNLRRGAELVSIPDEVLLEVYELLRPGRAGSAAELLAAAQRLRADYGAEATARLIEEAAAVYERRNVFGRR
jgi:propanediol dehydratase small subunit